MLLVGVNCHVIQRRVGRRDGQGRGRVDARTRTGLGEAATAQRVPAVESVSVIVSERSFSPDVHVTDREAAEYRLVAPALSLRLVVVKVPAPLGSSLTRVMVTVVAAQDALLTATTLVVDGDADVRVEGARGGRVVGRCELSRYPTPCRPPPPSSPVVGIDARTRTGLGEATTAQIVPDRGIGQRDRQ